MLDNFSNVQIMRVQLALIKQGAIANGLLKKKDVNSATEMYTVARSGTKSSRTAGIMTKFAVFKRQIVRLWHTESMARAKQSTKATSVNGLSCWI